MKILIVGNGGREHALAWKIKKDIKDVELYLAPGNGGTKSFTKNIDISPEDIEGLLNFAKNEKIDLTVVGPEIPLTLGIVDRFKQEGLKIFGANKKAAQLEGSKEFSKNFMNKYSIPTARYKSYTSSKEAREDLNSFNYPLVIKADGLCYGKGVIICEREEEAVETIEDILDNKIFGQEGAKIIIEEYLDGFELSLLCLVSNNKLFPLEPAKDYKRIYDGDRGPNTGGVGCYSSSELIDEELREKLDTRIIKKIEEGLEAEDMNYHGVIFIGLMIVKDEPYVLEFNVRFGDPESQVVIPRLESNLVELFNKSLDGELKEGDIAWKKDSAMTVILTSRGYPSSYDSGYKITGLDDLDDGIISFHNGTDYREGEYFNQGGRVLSITSLANNVDDIREVIYRNIEKINFEGMHYRKDIGEDIKY